VTDVSPPLAPAAPASTTANSTPAAAHAARRDRFAAERDALTRRWNRVANLRLLVFAAAAAALAWGIWRSSPAAAVVGAALLVGFVALAVHHNRLGRQRRRVATLVEINAEAVSRLARDWDALPLRHDPAIPPDHPFAADLDLVGRASLGQLLDTTATPMGEAALRAWLLAPADPPTVRDRQTAAAELAPRLDLRQELELRGRLGAEARANPEPFLAWAEGEPWLAGQPWLRAASWLGPALVLLLLAAQVGGLVDRPWWALLLAANLALFAAAGRPAHGLIAAVAVRQRALLGYADALALLSAPGIDLDAPLLRRLRTDLAAAGASAPEQLRRLSRITAWVIPASSLLYFPIQALTLWDLHVLAGMERWQRTAGGHVRRWLALLGQAEALAALAALAHDHPDWVFPNLDPAADRVEATALAHPLLPEATRVANDVEVGPTGTFLLVTGSNMSGKSTLLRAIGVNAVLAGAGGPVCATGLRLPPVALWTSVRVEDSLARGVSLFMAELQRLKLVVDAARRAHDAGGPPVLYLLDEILHGTNTAERQIAARRIIAHLVDLGALGAVSTHDLALADAPELAQRARPVHFADTVGDGESAPAISFDYRLRPGVATTTNALRLMQLVGLDVAPAPDAAAQANLAADAARRHRFVG